MSLPFYSASVYNFIFPSWMLSDVVGELKTMEVEEDKGFLGIFRKGGNRLSNMKAKYEKAESPEALAVLSVFLLALLEQEMAPRSIPAPSP